MKTLLKTENQSRGLLQLDPRTLLLLLIIGNVAVFIMPSLKGEVLLTTMVLLLALLCGSYSFPLKITVVYFFFLGIDYFSISMTHSVLLTYIALFARFTRKVMPCAILGSILISTTRVNEFMAALSKIHVPKSVLIPMTVMLRYFPAIAEDTKKIKNAMKMRDISPGFLGFFKKPRHTIECIYVPIMMSASRRADELSASAVSRGIENPKERTSIKEISFHIADGVCIIISIVYMIFIWRI